MRHRAVFDMAARLHDLKPADLPHARLHVGALGAADRLEALEGLALVFKPEE